MQHAPHPPACPNPLASGQRAYRVRHLPGNLILVLVEHPIEPIFMLETDEGQALDPDLPVEVQLRVSFHMMDNLFREYIYPRESPRWIGEFTAFCLLDLDKIDHPLHLGAVRIGAIHCRCLLEREGSGKATRGQCRELILECRLEGRVPEFHTMIGLLPHVGTDLARLVWSKITGV